MAIMQLKNFARSGRLPSDDGQSRLLPGLTIDGHLEVDGEIYIDGTVNGRIDGVIVIIGPQGIVVGDIVAREVRIEGTLEGRTFAHHVSITQTARVTGRVFHHTISVDKGARIDARMPWRPLNYFETLDQLPETRS
jgi:cytoskeletal protein CcmA (bactofilin family)